MGNLADDQTKNVTLFDDSEGAGVPITATTDGEKKRLDIDAKTSEDSQATETQQHNQIKSLLTSIRDEIKQLNVKFNMVYELDKLDDTEAQ